jgi:hypothetical protein
MGVVLVTLGIPCDGKQFFELDFVSFKYLLQRFVDISVLFESGIFVKYFVQRF